MFYNDTISIGMSVPDTIELQNLGSISELQVMHILCLKKVIG